MATIAALTENFEGGSNGAAVSTGNSIFDTITGAGTSNFTNDFHEGTLAVNVTTTASTSILRADITNVSTIWIGFYLKIVTTPDSTTAVSSWFSNTTKVGDFRIGTDNTVSIRDNNTTVWTSTALATGVWHRIAIKAVPNSATGHRVRIYSGANLDSMTISQDSGDLTATAAGMTAVDNVRLGVIGSSTTTVQFDRLRGDDAAEPTGIGGAGAVTADAGTDQADVEPYSIITLTGSASGGTGPYTYGWSQTAGSPTVTLSGSGTTRTFTAPALLNGTALTFEVTATDSLSVNDTDTVIVTVQVYNEFTRTSGNTWVPYQNLNRTGGNWE